MQRRKGEDPLGCFSFWYCDDGQVICRPADVSLFLECLDAAAAKAGATRGEGSDVKSTVKLVGHPEALASFSEDWITDSTRRTCKVGEPNSPEEVLGAMLGPQEARDEHFQSRVQKTKELQETIPEVADPATELTLGRLCANVSRVTHLLRVSGTMLSERVLLEHDDASATFVARALGGDLPAHSDSQAALGLKQGGLGFRQAASLAVPAALASMVEARPFVKRLFTAMGEAGVALDRPMARFDCKIREATQLFKAQLSDNRAARVDSICEQDAARADERLTAIATGINELPGPPVATGQSGERLLAEPGHEDPELPLPGAKKALQLQHLLAGLVDRDGLDKLKADFSANEASRGEAERLEDLQDATCSSDWLWSLDPQSAATLEPEAYVAAARLRMGAGFALEPLHCRACRGVLDPNGKHALCCAPGESTKGHNDVRDAVFDLARLADATAEKEVLGLLETAPGLRPADVLTTAVSPGLTSALDVGIAAPHARHAGTDCTESMRLKKRAAYSRHLAALEAEGVEYKPLTWSCWGREHPDTTATLTQLARQAARRKGYSDHMGLLCRTRAQIGAALARRAAAMLRACLPGRLS